MLLLFLFSFFLSLSDYFFCLDNDCIWFHFVRAITCVHTYTFAHSEIHIKILNYVVVALLFEFYILFMRLQYSTVRYSTFKASTVKEEQVLNSTTHWNWLMSIYYESHAET